jgi:hypothetical protein
MLEVPYQEEPLDILHGISAEISSQLASADIQSRPGKMLRPIGSTRGVQSGQEGSFVTSS